MVEKEALKRVRKVKQPKEDDRRVRYLWNEECRPLVEAPATEGAHETSTMSHSYTKPAGISLLVHIILLCLALLLTGQAASSPVPGPPPIEIEIEPSRLIDMGSGTLHITSGSPPPMKAAKPRTRMAATAVPKPTPSEPAPPSAPTSLDPPPPPLPGEVNATSVTLPLPGDKETTGGGTGSGAGGASGGGKGTGGSGAGTGSSIGDGEGGGDYAGNGLRYGALPRYPGSARRAGREGIVTVRVLVGADGNAASVTVRQSSGREDFDDAAVQAVKKWRFSPARRGKEPVASFHDVRIRFRLDEGR